MGCVLVLAVLSALMSCTFAKEYSRTFELDSGEKRYIQFRLDKLDYHHFNGIWFGKYDGGKLLTLAYATNRTSLIIPESTLADERFEGRLETLIDGSSRFYTLFEVYVNVNAVDAGIHSVKWDFGGKIKEKKYLWVVDGISAGCQIVVDGHRVAILVLVAGYIAFW